MALKTQPKQKKSNEKIVFNLTIYEAEISDYFYPIENRNLKITRVKRFAITGAFVCSEIQFTAASLQTIEHAINIRMLQHSLNPANFLQNA